MTANLAVVGAQWGDEGKGKVVDLVCERFDVVARYQGGPNAGHTVTINGRRHALQHIPSGVFRQDKRIVIGNGTVLDLPHLLREIEGLEQVGIGLHGRLFISNRAHVILPIWTKIDALNEKEAGELAKIGTTQRGIGPTYEGKAARLGIRVGDLDDEPALVEKVRRLREGVPGQRLKAAGEELDTPEAIAADLRKHAKKIAPFVADTTLLLNDWMDEGKSILFEGAQGTLLDLDHGSYPFVTSSSTVAGGLCAGLGISPRRVDQIAGVFKAYCSRVGSGPMPTELSDGEHGFGELLRQRGREFGTVTGRPRRTGWFDGVAAAYANRINRFDAACVMLLDVLDALDEIPVCTGYKLDGKTLRTFPATNAEASRIEPVFETLPGWHTDTTKIVRWEELPKAALHYLDRLGQVIGAEVALVSVGPDRAQTIVRPGSALWRRLA
ncbi:MAG TPA: adenylosuccinate synthase [Candidatus Polarisedimenticolaceae bacterium]|nr:adenylosuccinate synthase [Candidatus Polarisedimenticolaceae bacterium]